MKLILYNQPYIAYQLLGKINKLNSTNLKEILKTRSRASTILPTMIDHTINVYNGQKYIPVYISDQMVGHKLGEFALSRIFHFHKEVDHMIKK
jgi:small subunit ribosomal protein S19